MRWLIEAADTKTGQETEITVEALTEAEAERLARYNGLLVSRISKAGYAPAPVMPYAKAADVDDDPPDFATLVLARRARSTERLGLTLCVLGWAMVSVGVGMFVYSALRSGWGDWANWRGWLPGAMTGPAWRFAAAGVASVAAGLALRLLAAMALVLRAPPAPCADRRGAPAASGHPCALSGSSD